ncbi:hypothetical protein N7478_005024 [Penicillium angulare]|uniref:uncharacterized protein n=1 Tax=Penicillium angulare TaxID=116970 RepID=UPI002541314A|nr:uncharacterized protein N7478_005024 [Penicillium angulare]KAJ5279652.1 hypothetical protein N7478_005024 [Penicillium angulare]
MMKLPLLRVLNQPAARLLLVTVVLYFLAFEFCRLHYWRDPHSAFFNIDNVFEWKYSLFREHEARHYTAVYNAPSDDGLEITRAQSSPWMCAALATVKRDKEDYFEASVGSLLSNLDPREREAMHVSILFANTDPSQHPSWGQKWVDRLADSASSYNVSEKEMDYLKDLEEKRDWQEKGVFDYVYLLNDCLQTDAPYIFVFEDDVILADGWMIKTLNALHSVSESPPSFIDSWLYLRLFYTETSLSWESSDFWYRNMPLAFFIVMASGLITLLLVRRRWVKTRSYIDNWTIATVCLVVLPAFTGLFYMAGKYSVFPLEGVVDISPHGCCTQGMVLPREQVPPLITYLQGRKRGQTDSIIEEYAEETGLARLALAPQQMQHVGLRSSRDNLEINTQSTWAFWFEENDPEQLKKEHEQLLASSDEHWILNGL